MLCESEEKTLHKSDEKYQAYVKILEEELVPAMGCTEPIAIAYAGAVARKTLGNLPEQLDIKVSGNIIKNVKSVIVPNTGGMRGIAAALCAGVIAGDAEALLEVIARVTSGQKEEIKSYMDQDLRAVLRCQADCVERLKDHPDRSVCRSKNLSIRRNDCDTVS